MIGRLDKMNFSGIIIDAKYHRFDLNLLFLQLFYIIKRSNVGIIASLHEE